MMAPARLDLRYDDVRTLSDNDIDDDMDVSTPLTEPTPRALQNGVPTKRRASAVSPGSVDRDAQRPQKRGKRAKYSSMACVECKKRKMKCVHSNTDGKRTCERCIVDGIPCVFAQDPMTTFSRKMRDRERETARFDELDREIRQLREQVSRLNDTLRKTTERPSTTPHTSDGYQTTTFESQPRLPPKSSRAVDPKQPGFVGHTRSAYALDIAKSSLSQLGVGAQAPESPQEAPMDVPDIDDVAIVVAGPVGLVPEDGQDPLLSLSIDEIRRLLDIFHEEVEDVYPCVDSARLMDLVPAAVAFLQQQQGQGNSNVPVPGGPGSAIQHVHLIKVAVSTGLVLEAHGKTRLSTALVESVEAIIFNVYTRADNGIDALQAVALLSIYYFHSDEELLAWRTIGAAARIALEMGLHRYRTLVDKYPLPAERDVALRLFWCIYVLDRRWSFGVGLSFALDERDMDPTLPEPGNSLPYLQCLVGYGRLCSRVWEALPAFGPSGNVPQDKEQYLDYLTQCWLSSIPPDLQLRHPRLGLAPASQPPCILRLRALLYLRGNHMRILVHRHHVLSAASASAHPRSAALVVDIAKDTIQVLDHLATSSDIYVRQQSAFNYFLVSALAVILLGVCHAPDRFFEPCRDSFSTAAELVRSLSHHSHASRRLWRSIRGLVYGVRALNKRKEAEAAGQDLDGMPSVGINGDVAPSPPPATSAMRSPLAAVAALGEPGLGTNPSPECTTSIPDTFQMGNELVGLFDVFGQPGVVDLIQQQHPHSLEPFSSMNYTNMPSMGLTGWGAEEILQLF